MQLGRPKFGKSCWLFTDGTALLKLGPGQEWVLESNGKRDLWDIRTATAFFAGYLRRDCETVVVAIFLFSRKFHPRTHINNLECRRHGGLGLLF